MLRPTTNLVTNAKLLLGKKEMKQRFMYVYNKGYAGSEAAFINRLWLSTLMPRIADDPEFGVGRKFLREWASYASKHAFAGLLELRKITDANDPHIKARVPIATFTRTEVLAAHTNYCMWFTGTLPREDHDSERATLANMLAGLDLHEHVVPGPQAIHNIAGLDSRAHTHLMTCLESLRVKSLGALTVVYADFRISPQEAQQLTTIDWLSIRNIDLYPLLMQWIAGQFGFTDSAPTASFPISKIAATLPVVDRADARTNAKGLSVDAYGNPVWLPAVLDSTALYEDKFMNANVGTDCFSLLNLEALAEAEDPMSVATKLPPNIPVLIDWVNKKYAYTMSTGLLKIQDLSRHRAADAAHIENMLARLPMTKKQLRSIYHIAEAAGMPCVVQFLPQELEAVSSNDALLAEKLSDPIDLLDYWRLVEPYVDTYVTRGRPIMLADIALTTDPVLGPLVRYLMHAHETCVNNIEVINLRYSVSGTSTSLGVLTLLTYAGSSEIAEASAKIRYAATHQGVDPSWQPPAIPLLGAEDKPIGMIPHQVKVRNILKDSPDLAILPVQAGGGKSVLTITDILYEIKNTTSGPYIVLCPAHLVAQYVNEVVYFTGSKLNVIPINTNSILRNGFPRLTSMISKAPRNTIVVTDYDVLSAKAQRLCYGTSTVTVYPVIEFLRQFRFGYTMLDESHMVKNDSQRTRACMTLITDIPKKRLASGTMAHDSPSDLALQIGGLDPTLFGSRTEFNETYGSQVRGERVVHWRPGAQQQIMSKIRSRVVVAGAMRKEWAALLPTAEEEFLGVDLTPNQYVVYNAIFSEGIERMRQDAMNNASLQKFFAARSNLGEDEESDEDLSNMLGFYLARVEKFVTAPGADEMGARLLKGDDLISPKVHKIIERVRLHLDQKLPGKILIFTNYVDSAEAIFNAMPEDLKEKTLLYKAAEKAETGSLFEKDPRYQIMVGVENSMNTGLNLQFVSRLIRVENVWNPGTLEQGNARVNRPNLKQAENRARIFYDWIVANGTFDVTKIARLISKIIAIAKFENTDNPAFEEIEDVPVIKLDEESILTMNTWDTLVSYGQAYSKYRRIRNDEYELYRAQHGKQTMQLLPVAPVPSDACLMAEVPYPPGLELYGAEQLGLIRVDEFLQMDASEPESDNDSEQDAEPDAEVLTPRQKAKQRIADMLVGRRVHTDFGDGQIKNVRMKGRRLNVRLDAGGLVRTSMAASFVMQDDSKLHEVRSKLLACVGTLPIATSTPVASSFVRVDGIAVRRKQRMARIKPVKLALSLDVSNGYLSLTYFASNVRAASTMQSMGFRNAPAFMVAEVRSSDDLRAQFRAWRKHGFTVANDYRKQGVPEAFADLSKRLDRGLHDTSSYMFSKRNSLFNFFASESKPNSNSKQIRPYPVIENGRAYIVMHTRGQAAVQAATSLAKGLEWQHGDPVVSYFGDLQAVGKKIRELMQAGIEIKNLQELKKQFKALRKAKLR